MQVDGVEALPVNEVITLLRGTCSTQLKYEIEYGLKRGTSDNSYLLKARSLRPKTASGCNCFRLPVYELDQRVCLQEEAGTTLIDVPDQSYKKHFGALAVQRCHSWLEQPCCCLISCSLSHGTCTAAAPAP